MEENCLSSLESRENCSATQQEKMIYDRAIDTIEAGGWQYHVDFQEMFHLQSHVMFILYAVSYDIHKYTFINM